MPTFKGYNGVPDIVTTDFSCASATVSKILYDYDPPTYPYRQRKWQRANAFLNSSAGIPLDLSIFPKLFPEGYHENTPLKIYDGIYLVSFGETSHPAQNDEPLAHYYAMEWKISSVTYGQYPWAGNYNHNLDEFTETNVTALISFKTNWSGPIGSVLGVKVRPLLGVAYFPYLYDVYDPDPIGIIYPQGCYGFMLDGMQNVGFSSGTTTCVVNPLTIVNDSNYVLESPYPTSDDPLTWRYWTLYQTSQRMRLMTKPPFGTINQGGDSSQPDGGHGNYGDEESDIIPSDGVPTISAVSSGFIKMYKPSLQNLLDFKDFLYSTSFIDNVKKLIDNPMDYIIALMLNPAEPNAPTNAYIGAGGLSSEVSAPLIANQYKEFDCGTVNIEECYGGFLDYDNMTRVSIYLPFCGTMKLDTNIVMHSIIRLRYAIDFLTGDCIAKVYVQNNHGVIAEFYFKEGNCACMIPMTGNNYASFFAGAIGAIAGATSAFGGNVAGALSTSAQSIASMHVEHERVGNIQKGHGLLGNYTPYVIIERPAQSFPAGMNALEGRSSNIGGTVSSFSGYIEIESIKLNGIQATDNELEEIKQLLSEGVYV